MFCVMCGSKIVGIGSIPQTGLGFVEICQLERRCAFCQDAFMLIRKKMKAKNKAEAKRQALTMDESHQKAMEKLNESHKKVMKRLGKEIKKRQKHHEARLKRMEEITEEYRKGVRGRPASKHC